MTLIKSKSYRKSKERNELVFKPVSSYLNTKVGYNSSKYQDIMRANPNTFLHEVMKEKTRAK